MSDYKSTLYSSGPYNTNPSQFPDGYVGTAKYYNYPSKFIEGGMETTESVFPLSASRFAGGGKRKKYSNKKKSKLSKKSRKSKLSKKSRKSKLSRKSRKSKLSKKSRKSKKPKSRRN